MRILLLVSSMHGGGAERVAALLSDAWSREGHDVTLMPTFSGRGECLYRLHPRTSLRFLADMVPPSASRLTRLRALRSYVRHEQPGVIVSFLPHVNVAALVATAGSSVPVIACERTFPPLLKPRLDWVSTLLRKVMYRYAASVVVQTEEVAEWVQRNCPGARTHVIPNPVIIPLPRGEPVVPVNRNVVKGPVILGAGRFVASKRFDLLVRAFASAHRVHPGWNLVLLGDGPERAELEALADSLGIREKTHMPGFVGNVGDWYEASQLYVLTSSYEGFPNTLVEAMAHGLPSISFDIHSGPKDILGGGAYGILLPDDDQLNRLTDALVAVMRDEDSRVDLARKSKHVLQTYSSARILSSWNDLLGGCAPG